MLYIYYGSNFNKVLEKTKKLCDDLRIKKPDALFFQIDDTTWDFEKIQEYISSQGLFEKKYIIFLKNILSN